MSHSDHGTDTSSSMTDDMEHDHSSHNHASSELFCTGSGTVMLNGFMAARTEDTSCVLFLFEGAAVDSSEKYVFAVLGAFCMGFANEIIRYNRDKLARDAFPWSAQLASNSAVKDIVMAVAFMVQMWLAYMLMLLVMLYEYVFLIFIILGLATGHIVSLRLARAERARLASGNLGGKTLIAPAEVVGSSGTPCCNNATA